MKLPFGEQNTRRKSRTVTPASCSIQNGTCQKTRSAFGPISFGLPTMIPKFVSRTYKSNVPHIQLLIRLFKKGRVTDDVATTVIAFSSVKTAVRTVDAGEKWPQAALP